MERNIAETGLSLLLEILKNFQASAFQNQFYKTYFLNIEQEIFAVLTDSFHKPGFKLHVLVLQHLFCVVDGLTEPLWDVSKVQYQSNALFVREYTINLLGASFPNIAASEVTKFVDGLLTSRHDLTTFKNLLRDFLVQSKEFSVQAVPRLPITHGIKCNDLFSFSIGCYIIWSAAAGTRYAVGYIRSRRLAFLVQQICKWCSIVLKSSALLSIWILIIPVLIGLLFELLVIVPMRVPIDESPVFLLYQDWALGLIFLKIWTRLVMLDQMAPLVDESWRMKFERVREDGFSRLRGIWVLHEIITPIVTKLLTALCVPYVLARGVFPVRGCHMIWCFSDPGWPVANTIICNSETLIDVYWVASSLMLVLADELSWAATLCKIVFLN